MVLLFAVRFLADSYPTFTVVAGAIGGIIIFDNLIVRIRVWLQKRRLPPQPTIQMAYGEAERLKLFEEWIKYEHHQGEFVVFVGDKEPIVQFAFGVGPKGSKTQVEVDTYNWQEKLGEPLPEIVTQQLVERGFHPLTMTPNTTTGRNLMTLILGLWPS